MLPNIANFTSAKGKLYRLMLIGLAILALLMMASPNVPATAADPQSSAPQTPKSPEATCPPGGQCFTDVPSTNPFYDFVNRIYQQELVSGYACGGPGEPCDVYSRPYYRPGAGVTRSQMSKFIDNARRLPEIDIHIASGLAPIRSRNDAGTAMAAYSTSGQAFVALSQSALAIYAQTGASTAIYGTATGTGSIGVQGSGTTGVKGVSGSGNGNGVEGESANAAGVHGSSSNSVGVQGFSSRPNGGRGVYGHSSSDANGMGVYGTSDCVGCFGVSGESSSGYGVFGFSSTGQAGHFTGNVQVTGNLSKGGGSFKIDHPLDPENKYLYHSFVESPDMMNVYNGNITTDGNGEAAVQMPTYFDALNRDFRYQLTVIGQFAQAIVWQEMENGKFTIKTDRPNVKVSWQVTGIRQDPYAEAHRIPVEEDKPADEQGKYLHPAEWGQPASSGIDYVKRQQMQQAQEGQLQP